MSWDIKDIAKWSVKDYPTGAVIPDAGNSRDYVTGGWRSNRPVLDSGKCTNCLICWVYCPDSAVKAEGGELKGFNYDHCKGCGICAEECAADAIRMVPEGCELEVK